MINAKVPVRDAQGSVFLLQGGADVNFFGPGRAWQGQNPRAGQGGASVKLGAF